MQPTDSHRTCRRRESGRPRTGLKSGLSPYFLCLLLGVLAAVPGRAQFEPPVIQVIETQTLRTVHADVGWTDPIDGYSTDEDDATGDATGPWLSRAVRAQGPPQLNATAWQKSWIDRFSIHGEGYTGVESQVAQNAEASSFIQVTFTVPVESSFSFNAQFSFSGDAGFGLSDYVGQVAFPTLPVGDGLCGGFISTVFEDQDTWEIDCTGTAPANSSVIFFLVVATNHGDGTPGETRASVEFDLNFGDRDHDDLLDVWEEEGIDLGQDGSIPLHAMPRMADNANPDIKDLYIEIDSLADVPFSPGDLDQLVQTFANAPVLGSSAAPGIQGIRLHLIHSEIGIPHPLIQGDPEQIGTQVTSIRNDHFGAPGDSTDLRFAKQFIFRYALIADQVGDADGFLLFENANQGVDGGAGNLLWVAAGSVRRLTSEPLCGGDPCSVGFEESLSGAFMGALGTTLSLKRGGQDDIRDKPNYLSVMNRAYQYPYAGETEQGTALFQYWKLDYSREVLPTLNEDALVEPDGLPGAAGRIIYYSSTTQPECQGTICLAIAPADGSPIDWSLDGLIDEETVQSDLNILEAGDMPEYGLLVGSEDWNQLIYGPALWFVPTSARIAPGDSLESTGFSAPHSLADVQAFLDADWVDLTDVVDADLSITKSNGTTTVTAGDMTSYTVVAENAGPGDAFGATVSDYPPAILTCSWTCVPSGGAACTPGPVDGDLVDTVELPFGGSVTYTVDCLVDPDAIGPISNVARVTPPPSVADLDPLDNVAVDTDDVDGSCGHPNDVVLEQQVIDTTVDVAACNLVTLGDQLEVVAPGQLIVSAGGRVEILSGFQVGTGAELRVGGLSQP